MITLLLLKIARSFTFLVPVSRIRKTLRKDFSQKIEYSKLKRRAKFSVKKGNILALERPAAAKIHVHGKNNKIIFKQGKTPLPLEISITGNGNTTEVGENVHIENEVSLKIIADNTFTQIGDRTALNRGDFYLAEDDSRILIGTDCLFSWNVDLWCTDGHSIIHPESRIRTNKGMFIEIGDHVWIGKDTRIGKNVKIASGCIVGWASIVTRSFEEENCIIAGVPAKIVKRDRTWDVAMPNDYDRNH